MGLIASLSLRCSSKVGIIIDSIFFLILFHSFELANAARLH